MKTDNIMHVARKLEDFFSDRECKICICNQAELLALVKTGETCNVKALAGDIQKELPNYECAVATGKVTNNGLQKMTIQLSELEKSASNTSMKSMMFARRKEREENVILIADDDMFMRSLATKALNSYGQVVALESGEKVIDTYLELSPDVLFLDIHMPGASGIEILDELHNYDRNSHVVMLSADSNRENILDTRELGAKGFVAKPFTQEKLVDALLKCPTIRL